MSELKSPTGKEIVVPPTHPNAGVQAAYRKRLHRIIGEMHRSLLYWISAQYRRNEPELASDESPAAALNKTIKKLSRRWLKQFEQFASKEATRFAHEAFGNTDASLKQRLKEKGFIVSFTNTREANDALQATISENVGLIKSIAEQHLSDVQGAVMRSVTQGRDLKTLTDELQERYKLTRKRAAFIARDQNNKATATITRVRQEGLGIKKAKWRHSSAGKHPRPSHVHADGEIYEVAKGMYIDGEYIRPGEKPNCRCYSESIIPGFED